MLTNVLLGFTAQVGLTNLDDVCVKWKVSTLYVGYCGSEQ